MLSKLSAKTAACQSAILPARKSVRAALSRGRRLLTSSPKQHSTVPNAAPSRFSNLIDMTAEERFSVRGELHQLFTKAITTAFPVYEEEAIIAPCNNPKFGDYQCNNAMPLFAKTKGKDGAPKNPRDAATQIVANLPANELISETSLAGPGFVNCKINDAYLATNILKMLNGSLDSWAPKLIQKRAIVDFSSPNVAKEMHVGHLRSTIIGDTICRVLEFCGVDVLRLNHIGDWGTQFGMLIQHMSESRPEGLGAEGGRDEDVADLQVLYRAAKKRFDDEPDFKTRAREAVTKLQSGEPSHVKAWQRICEASRKEFQAIYDRLGVTLKERGESFYNPFLKDVVQDLMDTKVAEISDGATCVFVDGYEIPLIVQKSDGGFGYASTDMAAIQHRLQTEKAEWIIYVTDVGQANHFDMIFKAARKRGWLPAEGQPGPRVDHVGFGLVLGADGKKIKSRSGDSIRLVELLDEAKARCKASILERRAEDAEPISEEELEKVTSIMGYGAVKYADLKNSRLTNYRFSFDEMLSMKGNTAVYLLYAHARIAGIVRKIGKDVDLLAKEGKIEITHPKERDLALHIVKFPEALEELLAELAPNRLTDYLYDLSDKFNSFYVECKVQGSPEETSRLLLCEATAVIMRKCFFLLGIEPLYKI